jgi:hypothetical protein
VQSFEDNRTRCPLHRVSVEEHEMSPVKLSVENRVNVNVNVNVT